MHSVVIRPKNEMLQRYVQYFLFFSRTDDDTLNYTTFPNNNLCLALYKQNDIRYIKDYSSNNCIIEAGNSSFSSRFYAFHKNPFQVNIHGSLDQICIVFHPAALRAFTAESYEDLMNSSNVFEAVFSEKNAFFLEQVFAEECFAERAKMIELLLLKKMNNDIPAKLKEALWLISNSNDERLLVETLAHKLELSEPSLFRLFKNHLGQNPKTYLKTMRFRSVLNKMIYPQNTAADRAYLDEYYDQAHFIKDFKRFSGYSPKHLLDQLSPQQNGFLWICDSQ